MRPKKLSGLQKDVLKLYRMCIRQVHKKPVENQPQFLNFVREEFYSKRDTINRKDFGAIEYLLRKGNRMLEVYGNPLVKNISS
ncbi:similar to Saccharomyces cerevisiae YDR379C-A SDH6 Protein involved in the assembly of the mitochondrial succinate dehydrogenase complex [Geotrichum candidum]|uniref:Similar to Saccharomyces cerevisiae YDR379C-A SDH6 Protein involved in the assembly of the mitochondrial succinate dehydrogenase complex n=1 Tax=Geotrichum candidum TaxID=1173061 RepID=A0A0J9XCZ2_GEOCN|nr:similar to Saccharomyces cerevisiae YDR379C-A SDH6 Protein involved in the assembly of the mitochondrial succinate dehydrogenase complex [Geotrichum candidum]